MNKVVRGRPRAVRMQPVRPLVLSDALLVTAAPPATPAGLRSRLVAWLFAWRARRRAARVRRRFAAFEMRLDARLRDDLGLGPDDSTSVWHAIAAANPLVLCSTRGWGDGRRLTRRRATRD